MRESLGARVGRNVGAEADDSAAFCIPRSEVWKADNRRLIVLLQMRQSIEAYWMTACRNFWAMLPL